MLETNLLGQPVTVEVSIVASRRARRSNDDRVITNQFKSPAYQPDAVDSYLNLPGTVDFYDVYDKVEKLYSNAINQIRKNANARLLEEEIQIKKRWLDFDGFDVSITSANTNNLFLIPLNRPLKFEEFETVSIKPLLDDKSKVVAFKIDIGNYLPISGERNRSLFEILAFFGDPPNDFLIDLSNYYTMRFSDQNLFNVEVEKLNQLTLGRFFTQFNFLKKKNLLCYYGHQNKHYGERGNTRFFFVELLSPPKRYTDEEFIEMIETYLFNRAADLNQAYQEYLSYQPYYESNQPYYESNGRV